MKKLIVISLLVVVAMAANAQKYFSQPSNTSVAGDTNYVPAAAGYDLKNYQDGVFSYTFTHTDVADSLSYARLEGSMDGSTWVALTGNAALSATSTDGQDIIYVSTPIIYRYLRGALAAATGDTSTISGQILYFKTE